jgi:cation diffusion facilitator CzcD-associated flavoprotein CzcO
LTNSDREVAIIGGGAAGIAAGRRLAEARIDCLIMEARPRLGGRAWTTGDGAALALAMRLFLPRKRTPLQCSDTIPLHVMWPWTPAGRQHLA